MNIKKFSIECLHLFANAIIYSFSSLLVIVCSS